ncbi:MAG: radical SAM protein [Ruminococcaceae bacterium]|nr:radical SAM protein [Oscillospiraceae bacterium]
MYSRVYVEVTNSCNMNCSFCHGHSRAFRCMTAEEFSSVLDALAGKTQFLYYHLMGEPLTHPALPEFLSMAKERGFHSVITTNGTLLARRGRALLDAGVYKVNISLHSFEKGEDEIFYRYLAEVSDFADRASLSGVIVVFRLWNNGLDGGRNKNILAFLRERFSGEWKENTRGIRIREKLHLEWGERFAWPDKDAPETGSEVFCYGLSDHFGILSDGTVVPCCLDSDGSVALGNIHETPIDTILSSPRAQAIKEGFARRHASEELCRRCGYATRFL